MDHEDLVWAPSVKIKDLGEYMHVQCLVDEEFYEIDNPAIMVSQETLFALEDLTDLCVDEKGQFKRPELTDDLHV